MAVLVVAGCEKPAAKPSPTVPAEPVRLENPRWRMDYSQPRSLAAFYARSESDNLFYRLECSKNRLTVLIYMEPVPLDTMPPFLELALKGPDGRVAAFARGRSRATGEGWAADVTLLDPFFALADEQPGLQVKIGVPDDPNPHWTNANDVLRDVLMDCSQR